MEPSATLTTALREVDLPALAAHLARTDRPAEELRPFFHEGEEVLLLVLSHLAGRLPRARTRAELEALAGLLPRTLAGLGPEAQRILAGLYLSLAPWLLFPELPPWREADPLPEVAVAWLRTELLVHPERIGGSPADERLFQALAGLAPQDLPRPVALIEQLCRHEDERLQHRGIELVLEAVGEGVLLGSQAAEMLRERLGSPFDAVVVRALEALGEPWARVTDPQPPPLAALLARGDGVKVAVVAAAARWRLDGPLRIVLDNPSAAPVLRQEALRRLGEFAGRDQIPGAIARAAADPLLLGAPLLSFLRGLHLRGQFLDGEEIPALLEVLVASPGWQAEEVASLTFPCRHALVAWLDEIGANDARWHRLALLVVALARGAAGQALPSSPAAILLDRLRETRTPAIRRALVAALGEAQHEPAEGAVLALLDEEPTACLLALRSIGGPATADALSARLGLDQPGGSIAPSLRDDRAQALLLLWKLRAGEPARRRAILVRLEPSQMPHAIAADLGRSVDPLERQILLQSAGTQSSRGLLERVAAQGDAGAVPIVAELLFRVVRDLHEEVLVNTGSVTEKRSAMHALMRPSEESASVGPDVLRTLRQLGRGLHQRGEIRPRCLLGARSAEEAAEALVADLALGVLDREDLAPGEQAIVLRLLSEVDSRAIRPRVFRLIKSRHLEVRKAAIACLARHGASDLAINLVQLAGAADIQTIRQSLLALAGIKATWAAEIVASCLEHRTMNIKKTAAEALREAGSPAIVPRLVFWLGRHDNPGFREEIIATLRALLGRGYRATMLAALDAQTDLRGQSLILEALDGELPPAAVRALVERESGAAPALLAALQEGTIRLGDGDLADLSRDLDCHGLLPALACHPLRAASVLRAPLEKLAAKGWDALVATELLLDLARAPLTPNELQLQRRFLVEWTRLATAGEPALRGPALGVVLALTSPFPDADRAMLARHLSAWLDHLASAHEPARTQLLILLTKLLPALTPPGRLRVVRALRALPPEPNLSGWLPFDLLRQAGAIVVRGDIEQALACARGTPDPVGLSQRVLGEAFGVSVPGGYSVMGSALLAALDGDLLGAARQHQQKEGLREVLGELIRLFRNAPASAHPTLLSCLVSLQPPGAAHWELADARPPTAPQLARPTDLHAPPSAALRGRLLAQLASDDPAVRQDAARRLVGYPDDEVQEALLQGYLHETLGLPPSAALACRMADWPAAELLSWLRADHPRLPRVLRLLGLLDRPRRQALLPHLIPLWEQSQGETAALLRTVITGAGPDTLASRLLPRIAGGEWGFLDLLGSGLLRVPEANDVLERARQDKRPEVAKRLRLDAGCVRSFDGPPPPTLGELIAQLDAMTPRPAPSPAATADSAAPADATASLVETARGSDPEKVREALSELARRPTPATIALLVEMVGHRSTRVRLHAHRLLRSAAEREVYLAASASLLDDPQPSICVSAIRVLTHGRHLPALPRIIELLLVKNAVVQRAAEEGLVLLGAESLSPLRRALVHLRPDRRAPIARVIVRIEAEQARQQSL